MNLAKLKSYFFKTLISCLIAAATLAVVTILIGKFNSISQNALLTILLVAIHAFIAIVFISNNEKQDTFDSMAFFTNVTFGILVLSFITSTLGLWGTLSSDLVGKLYGTYFILLFATLHGQVLAKTRGKQSNIDKVVTVNFLFMTVVVLMLLPIVFTSGTAHFGGFYYRLLAACGIIDATLTLIAVILHNLYVQKHPKVVDPVFGVQQIPGQPGQTVQEPKRHMNALVLILIVIIGLQFLASIIVFALGKINQ